MFLKKAMNYNTTRARPGGAGNNVCKKMSLHGKARGGCASCRPCGSNFEGEGEVSSKIP